MQVTNHNSQFTVKLLHYMVTMISCFNKIAYITTATIFQNKCLDKCYMKLTVDVSCTPGYDVIVNMQNQ